MNDCLIPDFKFYLIDEVTYIHVSLLVYMHHCSVAGMSQSKILYKDKIG